MDVDWPVELLRLDAEQLASRFCYRAHWHRTIGRNLEADPPFLDAARAMLRLTAEYGRAARAWTHRPVACVACEGTGADPAWGYCLMCDGHKVTTPELRATLQSVKAMNLAIAAGLHQTAMLIKRRLDAHHAAQEARLGLGGRWDV